MLPILKEYFASRLFLKVNISSACRDYKYIPYPSLEVQSSVRDIRQKSKLDCNDHCQNSQRCPPSQHPLCWLTIRTKVLAMTEGRGGLQLFSSLTLPGAPWSPQCLTGPVSALPQHPGQGGRVEHCDSERWKYSQLLRHSPPPGNEI